jgi:hypothetical protein
VDCQLGAIYRPGRDHLRLEDAATIAN